MRIATNQVTTRALNNILNQQQMVARIQEQISTGKKVLTPSDDPVSAARIDLLKRRIEQTERFQANRDAAVNQLSNEETVLDSIVTNLHRVRELQVQSGNSTLSRNDRLMIAEEVNSLLTELESLANSQDSSGRYLFSGGQTLAKTITQDFNGNYLYNGDDTVRHLPISSGSEIAINDTGSDLFMRIRNGNGRFTVTDTGAPNTGGVHASTGTVVDESAYVQDTYTISFVSNSGGDTVVMVVGDNSGNVIPVSGLADDAPVYTDGMALTFNGIEIDLKGDPQLGDDFIVAPSTHESIFSTVSRMLDNLTLNPVIEAEQAQILTENNQLLAQIDTAIENVLVIQSQVGTRLSQADVADNVNEDFLLTSKKSLSSLENADLAEAAIQLSSQTIILQAAQQSFTRIQNLSLFNYL